MKTASVLLISMLLVPACSKKQEPPKPEEKPTAAEPTAPKEDPKPAPKEEPKPTMPAGVTCIEDTNKKIEGGKLVQCRLQQDYTSGKITCGKEYMAFFFADGSLKGCYVSQPTEVDGWSCRESLSLFPGGKFRRCRLAGDKEEAGVQLKSGDWITVYQSGALRRVENETARKMGAYMCKGSVNLFHENGKLKRCEVAKPTRVGKKRLKVGEAACLDADGKPTECGSVLSDISN